MAEEKKGPSAKEQKEKEDKAETRAMWQQGMRFGAVGLEMGLATAFGAIGGAWLDQRFDTAPLLGLLGLFVGLGAAGKALWDVAKKMSKSEEEKEK